MVDELHAGLASSSSTIWERGLVECLAAVLWLGSSV